MKATRMEQIFGVCGEINEIMCLNLILYTNEMEKKFIYKTFDSDDRNVSCTSNNSKK